MDNIIKKYRIIPLKIAKKAFFGLFIIFVFDFFLFPAPVLANQPDIDESADISNISQSQPVIVNNLPATEEWATVKEKYFNVTAYNSEVAQCDDTPCITANGFDLCAHGIEDSVATNILPFGAKIRMPELFGTKVFVVRDRMNARYTDRLDIWMLDKQLAKNFGLKYTKVEILEP